LVFAAYWFIQGAVKFSHILKLTPLFIGLIVAGFGTSAPEAGVGVIAAVRGQGGIALGNILGSNIANIGLVLGLCAIFTPLAVVNKGIFKREMLIMLLSVILLYVLSMDLVISRFDGLILVLCFIPFCLASYLAAKKTYDYKEIQNFKLKKWLRDANSRFIVWLIVLFSILGILLGAHLMLNGGLNLARIFGINPWIIGIIVFAFFTSLPELAVSLTAALKKVPSVSIGNIIGSNIFNVLFILGIVSMIKPINLPPSVLILELPAVFLFSFILLVVMKTKYRISRIEGLAMFLGYIGFIVLIISRT